MFADSRYTMNLQHEDLKLRHNKLQVKSLVIFLCSRIDFFRYTSWDEVSFNC